MKKFLSMVMALAMTLTLVTVGASAKDFTDKSSISYKEAVDVISTLGVVDGYTDGSYNPTATLTRGAAAKIICNLMLGPTTAAALGVTSAPFSDVPVSNVFAGYIAYCSSQGIINGYADGTFKPAATVTGYQFMKMLLGALGYDGSIEGFTGTNWTVNVAKLAVSIGLDDGNDSFVGSNAMTREEAALYAFNTLTATMVEYSSKGTTITINGASIVTGASSATEVANKSFDYRVNNTAYSTSGTMQFCEKYFPKLTLNDDPDSVGRSANTWTYKNVEIGTYDSSDAVLTFTQDMTSTTNKAIVTKDLKNYDLSNVVVSYNGYDNSAATVSLSTTDIAEMTGNGVRVEVYADGTDVTRVVVVKEYLGQVTKVNTTDETITVALVGTYSGTSFTTSNGYGTYSKDEYVMVTPVFSDATTISSVSADKANATITAATKVTGTTTYSSSTKVTVGGTSYSVAAVTSSSMPSLKSDTDLYLDAYGYAVYASTVASKDYVYAVTAYINTDSYGAEAVYFQGVMTDGSTVIYKINTVDGSAIVADPDNSITLADAVATFNTNNAGKLFSYSISSSKITLTSVTAAAANTASYVTYVTDTPITSSTYALSSKYFTDSTTFISVTGTLSGLKVSTSTGKQLVTSSSADYAIVTVKSLATGTAGDMAVVFVNTSAVSNESNLVLVKSASAVGYTTLSDTDYNTYNVYINGAAQEIAIDTSSSDTLVKGQLYTYGMNSDSAYVLTDATGSNLAENKAVSAVYGSYLTVATVSDTLTTDSATYVDLTDNGVTDNASLKDLFDSGATVTVSVVYDSDNQATYVYVISATAPFTLDSTTYTLTPDTIDNFSSITYVVDGVTYVTSSTSFTSTTAPSSIKVSTTDGYTLTGVVG